MSDLRGLRNLSDIFEIRYIRGNLLEHYFVLRRLKILSDIPDYPIYPNSAVCFITHHRQVVAPWQYAVDIYTPPHSNASSGPTPSRKHCPENKQKLSSIFHVKIRFQTCYPRRAIVDMLFQTCYPRRVIVDMLFQMCYSRRVTVDMLFKTRYSRHVILDTLFQSLCCFRHVILDMLL